MGRGGLLWWWCGVLVGIGLSILVLQASASEAPAERMITPLEGLDLPERSRPFELPPPSSQPPLSVPDRVLPSVPPEGRKTQPGPQVEVRQIIVTGSTVFSLEEIGAVTQPYIGRVVNSEALESLRLDLSQLYLEKGYINSGAVLPDQRVSNGIIHFAIIEGELTDVIVTNNRWFRESYLRRRLTLGITPPLHLEMLQHRLYRLQQDDRITRFQAQLRPGIRLGQSELYVRVEEAPPFQLELEFNNYQSPTIGASRGLVAVTHRNLTGYGDTLRLMAAGASGRNLRVDASYIAPLNARDTTLSLRYRRNRSLVVEPPFDRFNIEGRSEIFTVSLQHPLYRNLQREFALSLTGEHLSSQTTPFSGLGAEDDRTTVTAFRLMAEWTDRTVNQVIAVRSQFSLGVDLFGATITSPKDDPETSDLDESIVPTGQFFVWLGQVQWVRRLRPIHAELLFRLDIQMANDPLFALEQMAIGGRFSVRGYRENELVRDSGVLMSLESRFSLLRRRRWVEYVQLVPFVDFGWGRNRRVFTPKPATLASVGIGIRWATQLKVSVPLRLFFEVFWGYRLVEVDRQGDALQDHGLHLQLVFKTL